MITILVFGLIAMSACLAIQALATVVAVRYFARAGRKPLGPHPWRRIFLTFAILMILLMLGNVVQIVLWAVIYLWLGAFADFETAAYFSGVTFTSLGYGDVLLTGRTRLLGPLEAANGLMMFGITSAVFIAAVQNSISKWSMRIEPSSG